MMQRKRDIRKERKIYAKVTIMTQEKEIYAKNEINTQRKRDNTQRKRDNTQATFVNEGVGLSWDSPLRNQK